MIEPLIVFMYAVGGIRQNIALPRKIERLRRSGEPNNDPMRNPTSQEIRVSLCLASNIFRGLFEVEESPWPYALELSSIVSQDIHNKGIDKWLMKKPTS